MSEFFLRYVTHDRRASYEALGWTCVGDGSRMGSHGLWSCVMKWAGDGEPQEPNKTQAVNGSPQDHSDLSTDTGERTT